MEAALGQRHSMKIGGAVETVAAQCSDGDGVEVLPVTAALPHLDRTRVRNCRWGKWRRRTSLSVPRPPTSRFYSTVLLMVVWLQLRWSMMVFLCRGECRRLISHFKEREELSGASFMLICWIAFVDMSSIIVFGCCLDSWTVRCLQ
jgi:hypothetical protein